MAKLEYPLISVIIPCYNLEKVIGKCIDSIIRQTYENIEIIIVNDGSQDRSSDVIQRYIAVDNRIILINKENGGPGSAYNVGLKIAKGELIYILDGDNYVDYDLLKKLYRQVVLHQVDVAVCGYSVDAYNDGVYDNVGRLQYRQVVLKSRQEIFEHILDMHKQFVWQSPCNKLYKRAILKGTYFEESKEYMMIVDSDFNMRILNKINKLAVIDTPLVHYVQYDLKVRKQITSLWRGGFEHRAIACEKRLYNYFKDYYSSVVAVESQMCDMNNFFIGRFLKILQTLFMDNSMAVADKMTEMKNIKEEVMRLWTIDDISYMLYKFLFILLRADCWWSLRKILQCTYYCQRYLPDMFRLMKAG